MLWVWSPDSGHGDLKHPSLTLLPCLLPQGSALIRPIWGRPPAVGEFSIAGQRQTLHLNRQT